MNRVLRTVRNLALSAVIGLFLGISLAVARVRLDRSVRDPSEVGAPANAPVIGVILRDSVLEEQHVFDMGATSAAAKGYRRLRANLQFLRMDEPPKVIMVTGAIPAKGRQLSQSTWHWPWSRPAIR
jgi:hypothetical protein